MIRINLLAADRGRSRRPSRFHIGQSLTSACTLMLVGTAVFIGWWYWSLGEASAKLDGDIRVAERETARLRSLIVQVQQFEQRRAQLRQRVGLIEQLRKGQQGPVHMLDQISQSVPDGLWLTDLKQQGDSVTIDGRCTTLTALSDLVANLADSGYFRNGVEILNSQVEQGQQAASGEIIKFSIKAQFAMPGG